MDLDGRRQRGKVLRDLNMRDGEVKEMEGDEGKD